MKRNIAAWNPGAIESVGGKLATDILGGIGFGIGAGVTERYILGKGRKNPGRAKKNIFVWNHSKKVNPRGYKKVTASLHLESEANVILRAIKKWGGTGIVVPEPNGTFTVHVPVSTWKKMKRTGVWPFTLLKNNRRPTRSSRGRAKKNIFVWNSPWHRSGVIKNPLTETEVSSLLRCAERHFCCALELVKRGDVSRAAEQIGRAVAHANDAVFYADREKSQLRAKTALQKYCAFQKKLFQATAKHSAASRNPQESRARFLRERVRSPKAFAKGSLRTVTRGKHRVVIGCPVGKYDRKKKRCRVGTRSQSVLHPMSEAFRLTKEGRKITVGRGPTERRITRAVARRKVAANPQEGEYNYIVIGWSRDPNIGKAQLAGYDGTLRFKKKADAIRLAKAQLKGVYDRTWVESVVYHKSTGWTSFDIIWDERKNNNPLKVKRVARRKIAANPMTLKEWIAKQPVRIRKHGSAWVIPDVSGLVDRRQAWQLSDYLVSSVTGGSIWFVRKSRANSHPRRKALCNPKSCNNPQHKHNPLLQTVMLANPPRPPWKDGQRVPIEKARAWVSRYGSSELKNQFAAAERLQKKANKMPDEVTWKMIPIGSKSKLDAVTAMVYYGSSPETMYRPPKGSKKGSAMYRHKWGDGSGGSKPVPVLATPGGRAMVMPLRKGQTIDDWMRG